MRTPEDAIAEILRHAVPTRDTQAVPLLQALGRVLAAEVVSDVDLPPFRKSAMDGYAVHSADFAGAGAEARGDALSGGLLLPVAGESRAGAPWGRELPRGAAVAIYTGAELPPGADAVVVVERSVQEAGGVRLADTPRPGQNVCERGEDLAHGAVVLRPGRRLSPTDLSVLAAVGREPVPVFRRPRVAILTSGDELVPPSVRPGAGQIREGNTLHLAGLARRAGAEVVDVGLVPDDEQQLAHRFGAALEACDVVLSTGGVSAGKYDLVAAAFQRCGVEEVFHKVAIKPGKPLWFGRRGTTLVFGLPGNPVSCLLDHEVFVRPALARLEGAGEEEQRPRVRLGRWEGGATRPNEREQNLPVRVHQGEDGVERLVPLDWRSSADIVGLAEADGMAVVPAGEEARPGQMLRWRVLDR